MHNIYYTLDDTNPITYQELGVLVANIFKQIQEYLEVHNTKIDIIAPALRSGGVLGSMCAVHFNTTRMLPVQFKYFYNPTSIKQVLSTPTILQDVPPSPLVLVCEGNTASGATARCVISEVKRAYPDSRILFATLTWVYDPATQPLEGIEAYFYGVQTNENFVADTETCQRLGLRKGITIFPWENAQDELDDINDFYEGV